MHLHGLVLGFVVGAINYFCPKYFAALLAVVTQVNWLKVFASYLLFSH